MNRRGAKTCLLILAALWLAGCATGSSSLFHDPSFTDENLNTGKLLILGTVSLANDDDPSAREIRSREFEAQAREILLSLSDASLGDAWIAADIDSVHGLLDEYRNTGRLASRHLQQLAPIAARSRFVMLARIDLDRVTYNYRRENREEGDRYVIYLEPESKRELSILFDVFDLKSNQLVWSTEHQRVDIERGRLHEVNTLEDIPTQLELFDAVREVTQGSERAPEPDVVRARRELYRKALRELPGAKRGK